MIGEQLSSPATTLYKVTHAMCGGILGIAILEKLRGAPGSDLLWAGFVLVPLGALLVRVRSCAHVTLRDSCLVVKVRGRQVHVPLGCVKKVSQSRWWRPPIITVDVATPDGDRTHSFEFIPKNNMRHVLRVGPVTDRLRMLTRGPQRSDCPHAVESTH